MLCIASPKVRSILKLLMRPHSGLDCAQVATWDDFIAPNPIDILGLRLAAIWAQSELEGRYSGHVPSQPSAKEAEKNAQPSVADGPLAWPYEKIGFRGPRSLGPINADLGLSQGVQTHTQKEPPCRLVSKCSMFIQFIAWLMI